MILFSPKLTITKIVWHRILSPPNLDFLVEYSDIFLSCVFSTSFRGHLITASSKGVLHELASKLKLFSYLFINNSNSWGWPKLLN